MQASEQQAIATVAVLAAWADGAKHEREREELRRVAESLGSSVNLPALLQQVILGRVRVQDAAAGLATPELRQLAFEIAVGVVDADGLRSEAET
ncbi:MAG TPA: GTPase, partial [Burkholderiaceae bacterium]|nr:GTPase [Burkholderiaceae bacterium]